ncbi:MAG: sigma-70 family RNA polymerase sigma factor [Oscillospiraceae bacterium]|nr:sigma-70 family RNA polymerase sigma factor [Oscillospiraceae bacterium]
MDDREIVALFYERSEQAIAELSNKYGDLCLKIALNMLNDARDAEECVNDAYLGAWNSIPPQNPDPLRTYLCRIVRNLALKKLRANTALKRGSQFDISLSELENCIPAKSFDEQLSAKELTEQINAFLSTLRRDDRVLFIKRYWFSESLSEIAVTFGITEHNASVRLGRIRKKLHQYLKSKEASL